MSDYFYSLQGLVYAEAYYTWKAEEDWFMVFIDSYPDEENP